MSSPGKFRDLEELAALYAAGALPAEERQAFEDRVRSGCPESNAAVGQFALVAAALGQSIAPIAPRPETRAALLRRIEQETAVPAPPALFVQRSFEATWESTPIPGVRRRILFVDRPRRQVTLLLRLDAGAVYPSHDHHGPEECLVLEGDLQVGDVVLREGDYQRSEAGSTHGEQKSVHGCTALVIAPLEMETAAS